MPKLDDYDDSHATNPVTDSAKASIANKVSSGTSTLVTATPPAASGFGAPAASGFGSPASSFGSTASTGFGAPSSAFGASPSGLTQTNSYNGTGQSNSNLASTGGAMQEGGTTTIETSAGFSDFINSRWRPMMAVIYMLTCFTDFVLFPVLWSILQAMFHGTVTSQWAPLTLQGAGLYHIAMGAVLGLAAYGRSQEKIAGKA
ncbi:Holin of 3TMs, for gene-transfer release [uncultured Caudovirales phage]|uniref:Holin of 3TMs, for gene-transfer release n=1 Tax=uncultured Caudovirales phage TaxID=2100421 RepID=A0A6J5T9C7_9CAUD|nr:Holin of 3TMs, for gene-transfer release [uncultured Caudovirales phage]